jgi:hypothetical protein
MATPAIARYSEAQHGLVTRDQALSVVSPDQLEYLLATGRLRGVRRSVYAIAGCPETWHQQLLAVCLAAGPQTVASFRAAAALWELDGFGPGTLEITVPGRQRRRLPRVIVHDSRISGPDHCARVHHVPVTSVARTICDLTAVVPWWLVRRALSDARRRTLVTPRQLERVFGQLAGRGRRRSTVMRTLLERELDGFDAGGSDREVDVCRWLVAAGLPKPVQQFRIRLRKRTIAVDAAYPDLKISIEYDGWEWHRGRKPFDDDRARDNELEIRGWMPLRFTSAWNRREIVETVRDAIARRRAEQATLEPDSSRSSVACSGESRDQAMQSAPKRMRSSA